jgi:hypothetical protein
MYIVLNGEYYRMGDLVPTPSCTTATTMVEVYRLDVTRTSIMSDNLRIALREQRRVQHIDSLITRR